MTPAERKAKLEAAQKLIREAESDEATAQQDQMAQAAAQNIAQAQAQVAASVVAKAPAVIAAASQEKTKVALQAAATALTGPGGDTRQSGQPSLWNTMRKVAKFMKGQK